jgi:GT2 family glycosyltransferase
MSAGIKVNMFTGSIYDIGSGKKNNNLYNDSRYVEACGGFAMMVRHNLFSKIGGFNENFYPYGWEDVYLCLRAKKNGCYTFYLPDAVLIHKGTRLGRKPNPLYEKSKVQNYLHLLKAHTSVVQKITIGICLPFRASILAFKMIFKGNSQIVSELFKGFFSGINNLILSSKSNK